MEIRITAQAVAALQHSVEWDEITTTFLVEAICFELAALRQAIEALTAAAARDRQGDEQP